MPAYSNGAIIRQTYYWSMDGRASKYRRDVGGDSEKATSTIICFEVAKQRTLFVPIYASAATDDT